ncbi:ABC transporter substrate-binding protein [Elioraea tepidiphila]|jgi:peptide/nickel transport system substrate-binding protein|uniref:ABC transporter substrate-binding protein n=1 Tax=Elioraea tepidiphila TaxID=457934 RepID=UPI000372220C|nr:ABC transporter substrate-binding protein [Elioraea tepidiphila]
MTELTRRRTLGLGAGLLASSAVAAPAIAQRRGGDAVIAITQAPPSLDAHVTSAQAARNINLHMYETLFARDENARPVPELAETVNISSDGLTYVFPLRRDVRFHNGAIMEAQDVVASIERYRQIGASANLLAAIDSVTASGSHEVTIRLKQVQSTFLDNLSSPRAPIAIYPAAEAAKPANQIAFIGTGPYRFVEYLPDRHVRLARFDGYVPNPKATGPDGFAGRKEVHLDSVLFRFMPELGARAAALEAGEVHLVETVDGPTAQRLRGNARFTIYRLLPFSMQVIKFNHALGATGDLNFRLAVMSALDMEEIMAIAFPDIYQLDGSWIYPGSPYHTAQGTERYNKPDLAAARALLGRSGYRGERLTFIVDNNRSNIDTATVVQQRVRELGVNIDISVSDWPTVSRLGFTPQGWNFWCHGFGIEPFEGPASVMAPWVGGTSMIRKDEKIDAWFAELNAAMEQSARVRIFTEFQRHMWENAVAIKAGNYGLFQAATARLRDFKPYRIPRMWGVTLDA